VTLLSRIIGEPQPGVQWYFNAQPIAGATNSALVLAPVSAANAGDYRVIASNSLGTVTNGPAT
jgi:hypothetical protein